MAKGLLLLRHAPESGFSCGLDSMARCRVKHKDLLTGIDVDWSYPWRFEQLGHAGAQELDLQASIKFADMPDNLPLEINRFEIPFHGALETSVMQ